LAAEDRRSTAPARRSAVRCARLPDLVAKMRSTIGPAVIRRGHAQAPCGRIT